MDKNLLYKDPKHVFLSSKLNVLAIELEKILDKNRDIKEYDKLSNADDLIINCIRSIARKECEKFKKE